jgi:hypothetical protein
MFWDDQDINYSIMLIFSKLIISLGVYQSKIYLIIFLIRFWWLENFYWSIRITFKWVINSWRNKNVLLGIESVINSGKE